MGDLTPPSVLGDATIRYGPRRQPRVRTTGDTGIIGAGRCPQDGIIWVSRSPDVKPTESFKGRAQIDVTLQRALMKNPSVNSDRPSGGSVFL